MGANENVKTIILDISSDPVGSRFFRAIEVALIDDAWQATGINSATIEMVIVDISIDFININDNILYNNYIALGTGHFVDNNENNEFPDNEYTENEELTPIFLRAHQTIGASIGFTFDPAITAMGMNIMVTIEDVGNTNYYIGGNLTTGENNVLTIEGQLPFTIEYKIRKGLYNLHVDIADQYEAIGSAINVLNVTGGLYYIVGPNLSAETPTIQRISLLTEKCNNLPCRLELADTKEIIIRLWKGTIADSDPYVHPVIHMGEIDGNNRDLNVLWSILDGADANAEDLILCFKKILDLSGVSQIGLDQNTQYIFFDENNNPEKGTNPAWPSYDREVPSSCPAEHMYCAT